MSLKQALKVLDTVGKSVPGLSKEFVCGSVSGGTKVSILAFEVANTIVKGENLLRSLSENNIQSLKEALRSEGVQRLVSGDMEELLMFAASDKRFFPSIDAENFFWDLGSRTSLKSKHKYFFCLYRLEFDVFLREVIRFGDRCKDSQWHNLGRYFSK